MGEKTNDFAELRAKLAADILPFVLTLVMPLTLASAPRTFDDGDVSWHVAVGRWIMAHGAIPSVDPFSFTMAGKPWVAMEWPADLILASAYNLCGYAGLAAVVSAALIALNGITLAALRGRVGPIGMTVTVIGMNIVLAPFMLARPHVLVWPIVALWTLLLARSSETGRPPPLWAPLLLLVWTNLHGSFPLAAVIAAPLALDALLEAKWATLRSWLLFAAVSAVAICLNFNGLDGLLQPFRVAQLSSLTLIQEWLPSTTASTPQFFIALVLVLGLLLWRGVRVPPGRLILLLAMLFLAFTQVRHQSWFAIVAAMLLPPLFGEKADPGRAVWPLAALAVPLLVGRALIPLLPPENSANPRALIAAVPPKLRAQPVFNGYTFGGPLILAGIRPYVDGRSELYGDEFMYDYEAAALGDTEKFDRAVAHYGIRWAMLPAGSPLAAKLSRSGWQRTYADKVGIILVRREGPAASAGPR